MTHATVYAPDGFQNISAGIEYYFIGNSSKGDIVLAFLSRSIGNRGIAGAIRIDRDSFEKGVSDRLLIVSPNESTKPTWVPKPPGSKPFDLSKPLGQSRIDDKKVAKDRLAKIQPALDLMQDILDAPDPNAAINALCRKHSPNEKVTRFRFWLLSYIGLGQDIDVLAPAFQNSGHWDRSVGNRKKPGAHNKAYGRNYGSRMGPEEIERICRFYKKAARAGKSMNEIHAEALWKEFGCKFVQLSELPPEHRPPKIPLKTMIQFHPENRQFPTLRQFSYHAKRKYSLATIQIDKHGRVITREKKTQTIGKFTQSSNQLMQRLESDARVVPDHPRGYIEDSVLPKLRVVTASDLLSSAKVGIGFSFEGESLSGYKMMMFCMAISKQKFCKLFGIDIQESDWPMQGMPASSKFDNGPGSSKNLTLEPKNKLPIKTTTPSYSPMSKATVEGSHRKNTLIKGEPIYRVSNLSPIQMMRREILDLIAFNKTADVSGKVDHMGSLAYVMRTPNGLWEYHTNQLSRYNRQMSFDAAVREYLTPKQFRLTKSGVIYDDIQYKSDELVTCGVFQKIAMGHQASIYCNGYILDMALRYIWVEIGDRLFEVEAQLKTFQHEENLYFSQLEHEQYQEAVNTVNSAMSIHKQAARSETLQLHHQINGKDWGSGRDYKGRHKKNATNRQESKEIHRQTGRGVR